MWHDPLWKNHLVSLKVDVWTVNDLEGFLDVQDEFQPSPVKTKTLVRLRTRRRSPTWWCWALRSKLQQLRTYLEPSCRILQGSMIFLQENVVGVERPWPEAVRRFHTSQLQILDFVHQCVFSHFPLITTFLNLYYLFFVAFISSASKTFTSVSMKWKSFSRTQNQICLEIRRICSRSARYSRRKAKSFLSSRHVWIWIRSDRNFSPILENFPPG